MVPHRNRASCSPERAWPEDRGSDSTPCASPRPPQTPTHAVCGRSRCQGGGAMCRYPGKGGRGGGRMG